VGQISLTENTSYTHTNADKVLRPRLHITAGRHDGKNQCWTRQHQTTFYTTTE